MEYYSVKQIAEMLSTNPETVRRWIRKKKLKAEQVSRKDGNVITGEELQRFLNATPKYLPKVAMASSVVSPAVGLVSLAGTFAVGAMLRHLEEKKGVNITTMADMAEKLKMCFQDEVSKLQSSLAQKQELIEQTDREIVEIQQKIEEYRYLLEHDEIISETVNKATITKED